MTCAFIIFLTLSEIEFILPARTVVTQLSKSWFGFKHDDHCSDVCQDLGGDDKQPVCMMFSRYKRGYQFFVNMCHARRAICRDNLMLEMVHPARCIKSKQFYMFID